MAINYTPPTNRSEFTYDGLSRCVKVVEKTNGSVTSTRKFVWCGKDMCEFRDANDAVTLFVYPQGQYSGTKYFYTRDHLGSIREMFKTNDAVVARYDYDPWERSTTTVSTLLPDFNYTGLYRHSASGLDMAVHRFHDPDLGRWLSRDPAGELVGGINLYGYVLNDPIDGTDPSGLFGPFDAKDLFGAALAAALAIYKFFNPEGPQVPTPPSKARQEQQERVDKAKPSKCPPAEVAPSPTPTPPVPPDLSATPAQNENKNFKLPLWLMVPFVFFEGAFAR
jgi:RHS repeat-associated protein